MDIFIGIDLGTTGCKAMALDGRGSVLGQAYHEYELIHPPRPAGGSLSGFVEQDARLWWNLSVQCVREALGGTRAPAEQVRALSISSQGIAFVPVDSDNLPLANAISWLDSRAEEQSRALCDRFGEDRMFRLTGKRVSPFYTFPKLLWLKAHEPKLFDEADAFLMAHDFLIARLTGRRITDCSMASGTICYDLQQGRWSEEILTAFDFPAEKLPAIDWAGTPVGPLTGDAAKTLGLTTKTLVVLGAQDQKAGALAAGADGDVATVSLGTASAIITASERPVLDKACRVPCCPAAHQDRFVLEGVVNTSGAAHRWACRLLEASPQDAPPDYEQFNRLAEQVPPGAGGVSFLPYLSGQSPPDWWPQASGVFWGLHLGTTRGEIIRAVLEGVSCGIRTNLDACCELTGPVKKVRVFGSGQKSELWLEILANLLDLPLEVCSAGEMVNMGAAQLAMIGVGRSNYGETLDAITDTLRTVRPDPDLRDNYQAFYRSYRRREELLFSVSIEAPTG